jgi:esterase
MTGPAEGFVELPAGRFRYLEWAGTEPSAVFLHGLSGVAEVWGPTIEALGEARPRSFAFDQRGHGQSPKPREGYSVGYFVEDALGLAEALGLERPHLVGHSMGARVAMVLAARRPERVRSVTIVDIGPEEWKANHQQTVAAFERMPANYPDVETAIGGAGRVRSGGSLDATLAAARAGAEALRAIAVARLRRLGDGSVTWRADRGALKQAVVLQRSRNYWREWERIGVPALLIRGGESNELRPHIAEEMRRRNSEVRYLELAGVGHNVPLLAPGSLAAALQDFWATVAVRP